jgi:hypothetical protein
MSKILQKLLTTNYVNIRIITVTYIHLPRWSRTPNRSIRTTEDSTFLGVRVHCDRHILWYIISIRLGEKKEGMEEGNKKREEWKQ